MQFPNCKVTSVRADIINGEITIKFQLTLNAQNLETAEELRLYADKDAGKVELRIIPNQPPLPTRPGDWEAAKEAEAEDDKDDN